MSWVLRSGVRVWLGDSFPEPHEDELAAYRPAPYSSIVETHGTLTARRRHTRRGEPYCSVCAQKISKVSA
jgi:hypothetical protein